MTRKLSTWADTIEPEPFPHTCPKCGQPTRAVTVERHVRGEHPNSIGNATFAGDPDFSQAFFYVGPVPGVTRRQWYVVWLNWPLQIVKIAPAEWIIVWAGTDPAKGDG